MMYIFFGEYIETKKLGVLVSLKEINLGFFLVSHTSTPVFLCFSEISLK